MIEGVDVEMIIAWSFLQLETKPEDNRKRFGERSKLQWTSRQCGVQKLWLSLNSRLYF